MSAYVVENRHTNWYTGAKHTNKFAPKFPYTNVTSLGVVPLRLRL